MRPTTLFLLPLLLFACSEYPAAKTRPAKWATPVLASGASNLFMVTAGLYRGEQPTATGMSELKKLGIKTVISLRAFHDDDDEIGSIDLRQIDISFKTWHPEREDVVKFLRIVTDPTNSPVFVHCQHGSDRTGTMCAVYRIVVQGWSKKEAIREMKEGDFGFHEIWQNLIDWINEFDIEQMKSELISK